MSILDLTSRLAATRARGGVERAIQIVEKCLEKHGVPRSPSTEAECQKMSFGDPMLAYITQTTVSIDETAEIIAVPRQRFPKHGRTAKELVAPRKRPRK